VEDCSMGYEDVIKCGETGICYDVCPMTETKELDEAFLEGKRDEELGIVRKLTAGSCVRVGQGQDGGVVTSLLLSGLKNGIFDCSIIATRASGFRAEPVIAESAEEIKEASGTKYVAVPMVSKIGEAIKEGKRKIAIVGTPCEIRATRKIQHAMLKEVEEIERGLLLSKKDLHYEIFDLIPDKFSDIFDFLVKEWDVINLRTVLTGVHAGLSAEEVRSRLIEEGEMFEKISNLAGEEIDKIASTFEGTSLEVAIEEYNRVKDFSGVDVALGKWVLEDTFTKLDGRREKGLRVFKKYLEIYTDCLNLKTMLRGKQWGATEEEINRFLIGAEVTRVYGETEGVREFLERMRETRYGYLIVEVDEDVMRMEHMIDEAMLRAVKELSSEEAFGFGQILRFLTLKDTEIRNLKLIAKLKAEGVGIDRIKGMVIRVGEGA